MTAAVNLTDRLYVDETGAVFPITNLFDCEGDECEPGEAVSAVAGSKGRWFAITLSDFADGGVQ